MATSITWPPIGGNSYSIPASGESNWPALSNFLIALASAQSTGAQKISARVALTSPVTVSSASDCLVTCKLTVPAAVTVNLPAGVQGQWFAIGDGQSNAATFNITIVPNGAETIAGLTSYILTQDGASVILAFTGAGNWTIIAQAAGEGGGGGVSRSALDAGTPGYVVINNGVTGLLDQEQYLSTARGGFGTTVAAFSGFLKFTAGVPAAAPLVAGDLPTIPASKISSGIVSDVEFDFLDGATSNIQAQLATKVNLTGAQTITDKTLTDPIMTGQAAAPTYAAGKVWYDSTDQTLRYYNDSTTDSVNIGQEINVKIRNTSGSTITPGQVVRITGAVGGVPTVSLAQSNSLTNTRVYAVCTETITNNSNGYGTIHGLIKNLNLSAFTDGDILFLSSSVAGGLTNVRPASPNYAQPIGSVSSNSASTGRLIVDFSHRRTLGYGSANQILGMNSGGTEQEYKTAAALRTIILPGTTKGDLPVHNGSDTVRLAVGTNGQVLTADSAAATGLAWGAASGGGYTVAVVTANPSPAVNNTQYLANTTSAAFTITLPAGTTGAKIKIQDDRGTWDSNNLTITPATGERIWPLAINTSLVCNVLRGWIELVWDGLGWSPNSLASTTLGSGGGLIGSVATTTTSAVNGVMYECDTTSAAFTLTLPSGTSAAVVGILDSGPFFSTNNLIVAPASGQFIDSGAVNDTLTFNVNRANCVFYRANGSSTWEIQTSSTTSYAPGFTPGYTGGAAIGVGYIGEVLTSTAGANVPVNAVSNNWANVVSMTITPGVWKTEGVVALSAGTATTLVRFLSAISLTSNALDLSSAANVGSLGFGSTPADSHFLGTGAGRYLNVSVNTTVYLVGACTFGAVGTAAYQTGSHLRAVRIA